MGETRRKPFQDLSSRIKKHPKNEEKDSSRMVSWIPLLGRHGLVNNVLIQIGLIKEPIEWFLYSEFSVI